MMVLSVSVPAPSSYARLTIRRAPVLPVGAILLTLPERPQAPLHQVLNQSIADQVGAG